MVLCYRPCKVYIFLLKLTRLFLDMYIGTYVCRGPNSALGVKSYHGATSCTDGLIAVRCVHSCVLINGRGEVCRPSLATMSSGHACLRARRCL